MITTLATWLLETVASDPLATVIGGVAGGGSIAAVGTLVWRLVHGLFGRITALEARIDRGNEECAAKLEEAERGCQQRLEEGIEDVRTHEVAPLREGFFALARRWREERGPDDTGVHELRAVERRIEVAARRTPPEMPAQTMIPPPPGGRKDD